MGQDKSTHKAMHPGAYVKQTVIPEGMTVTKAAKLLGVGRPALSNFLNGNAELSPEMAVRLERAFGADSVELIELQARFNLNEENVENESVVSGVYRAGIGQNQDSADTRLGRQEECTPPTASTRPQACSLYGTESDSCEIRCLR